MKLPHPSTFFGVVGASIILFLVLVLMTMVTSNAWVIVRDTVSEPSVNVPEVVFFDKCVEKTININTPEVNTEYIRACGEATRKVFHGKESL